MRTASGSLFAFAAALAVPLGVAVVACSDQETPHPPEIGGCTPVGDASCRSTAVGGGAGGSSQEPDSGEAADAPLDVEVTDALLACAGGTDQTLAMVATSSPACAECLASGMDSGLANCCADATSCSMDSQCLSLVTCELACTSGPLCNCAGVPPPANSLSTYNLLAQCAADICAGQCPMLQHVTLADQ